MGLLNNLGDKKNRKRVGEDRLDASSFVDRSQPESVIALCWLGLGFLDHLLGSIWIINDSYSEIKTC